MHCTLQLSVLLLHSLQPPQSINSQPEAKKSQHTNHNPRKIAINESCVGEDIIVAIRTAYSLGRLLESGHYELKTQIIYNCFSAIEK